MTNYAQLPQAVPAELADEFLKRLPYVSEGLAEFRLSDDASQVVFRLKSGFEDRSETVASGIANVAEKLCFSYRPGMSRVVAQQDTLPSSYSENPHDHLKKTGELVEFGRGRFGFGPMLVGLIAKLDELARERANEFSAPEYEFPALIGAEVLDRCRYLRNFPSSLNMVEHLREDLPRIQEFAKTVTCDQGHLQFDSSSLSGVETLLSPSVCFHWYNWLRDRVLPAGTAITAWGKCFRYESSNLSGLERLWDFSMREIIFVGPPQFVLDGREKCISSCVSLLDDLGLAYEISTATDPFFVDSYAVQAAFQKGFELKFELLCPLPYSGKKLAVGSVNYHQDFFGRTFGIESDQAPAHTGCLGFGLERLALAFLAQHGVDESAWPSKVRRVLGRAKSVGQ